MKKDKGKMFEEMMLKKALKKIRKDFHTLTFNPLLGLWQKDGIYYTLKNK